MRATPDTPPLRFDVALQLLLQAGLPEPAGARGSDEWLQGLIDALVDLSSRDALTGLANRRSFELALSREIDRVARSGEPALLLVLDIDHFKQVNDRHGHGAGDLVITAVARALLEWTWSPAPAARSSPSCCPAARRPSVKTWPSACAGGWRRCRWTSAPTRRCA